MKILSAQPNPPCPAPQPCLQQRAARKPRAVPTTGTAVAAFTVAASRRVYDQATGQWKDGDTLFLRCSAWRELADHAAETLTKGTRVIVTGRLKQRSYETPEGRQAHRLRGRRRRRRPLAEVGHRQDRQDQPGQGPAPRRRRRPVAGRASPPTRRDRTTSPRSDLHRFPEGRAHPGAARSARLPVRPRPPPWKGPDVRDHDEESFSDGTPIPRGPCPAGRARARARPSCSWPWPRTPTG